MYSPLLTDSEDGDIDIYRISLAADERSRRFPQNGASYEILQRRRDTAREEQLQAGDNCVCDFETMDYANLKRFVDMLTQEAHFIRVQHFAPFGEFEHFARRENRFTWRSVEDIIDLLYLFRDYKGYPRAAKTPHTFHTSD